MSGKNKLEHWLNLSKQETSDGALEAAIQGLCVVPPEEIGKMLMNIAQEEVYTKTWTDDQRRTVAALFESAYSISQE